MSSSISSLMLRYPWIWLAACIRKLEWNLLYGMVLNKYSCLCHCFLVLYSGGHGFLDGSGFLFLPFWCCSIPFWNFWSLHHISFLLWPIGVGLHVFSGSSAFVIMLIGLGCGFLWQCPFGFYVPPCLLGLALFAVMIVFGYGHGLIWSIGSLSSYGCLGALLLVCSWRIWPAGAWVWLDEIISWNGNFVHCKTIWFTIFFCLSFSCLYYLWNFGPYPRLLAQPLCFLSAQMGGPSAVLVASILCAWPLWASAVIFAVCWSFCLQVLGLDHHGRKYLFGSGLDRGIFWPVCWVG